MVFSSSKREVYWSWVFLMISFRLKFLNWASWRRICQEDTIAECAKFACMLRKSLVQQLLWCGDCTQSAFHNGRPTIEHWLTGWDGQCKTTYPQIQWTNGKREGIKKKIKKPRISARGWEEMEDFHPLIKGYQILRFTVNKRTSAGGPFSVLKLYTFCMVDRLKQDKKT